MGQPALVAVPLAPTLGLRNSASNNGHTTLTTCKASSKGSWGCHHRLSRHKCWCRTRDALPRYPGESRRNCSPLQAQPILETPPATSVLNFGKWTIPTATGEWRLGASYEWNRTDLNPTQETKAFLLSSLATAVPDLGPVSVVDHLVGLRPVSRDRRPAAGPYPGVPGWFVLNGLGTRGVLIGPRWASHLIRIISKEATQTTDTQPSRLIFKTSLIFNST